MGCDACAARVRFKSCLFPRPVLPPSNLNEGITLAYLRSFLQSVALLKHSKICFRNISKNRLVGVDGVFQRVVEFRPRLTVVGLQQSSSTSATSCSFLGANDLFLCSAVRFVKVRDNATPRPLLLPGGVIQF
jgi:hypothetical protein